MTERVRLKEEAKQHGGKRKGSGRKPGSTNNMTKAEIADITARLGTLPHRTLAEWALTGIMQRPLIKDGKLTGYKIVEVPLQVRVDCAKASANYYAPRLISSVAAGTTANPGANAEPTEADMLEARRFVEDKLTQIHEHFISQGSTAVN